MTTPTKAEREKAARFFGEYAHDSHAAEWVETGVVPAEAASESPLEEERRLADLFAEHRGPVFKFVAKANHFHDLAIKVFGLFHRENPEATAIKYLIDGDRSGHVLIRVNKPKAPKKAKRS